MIIARWSIDVRFGYKPIAIEHMRNWLREIGSQIGWTEENARILTGSVGAHESTIQAEIQLKDLAELSAAWDKLAKLDAHKDWSKELEPYIVSGSPKWEIFRIVE
ncbi:hypothetical protein QU481_02430 [Crenobacter sp. SG2303]|uniref:NIPSNAP domain-containing protein n=1 Tax=Crenobacter oryzisoli TaxID=3056844 RepID=A0ABT7XJ07_9NEIS|nr:MULTISPECIES: hypothetical protein [unclassified Crenobacter]MDN0073751.1 hypothetical protein [Crenobacter sp. SG2303]MDN0082735.1 hypothetical protein [Crenobacter sp. SG2305]